MYVTNDKKNGKKCTTSYKVMKENDKYSLLDINIDSGRKNQIRVQFGFRGHHVIGDDKYGQPSNPLKRLGLHAYNLAFKDPETGRVWDFKSPIPEQFTKLFHK